MAVVVAVIFVAFAWWDLARLNWSGSAITHWIVVLGILGAGLYLGHRDA
jgi:hypothetical protein